VATHDIAAFPLSRICQLVASPAEVVQGELAVPDVPRNSPCVPRMLPAGLALAL
jgi:hypothetical protein